MATRKNVKIDFNGQKYKVPIPIMEFIKRLSELVRNHEMALFMYKYVIENKKGTEKEIDLAKQDLTQYIMRIPNAETILENMDKYRNESLELMKKAKKFKTKEEKDKFLTQEVKKLKQKDPWIVK